jgi:solute carrier family 26 (sodium-independent sulfate anion transporter), member 11
MGLLNLGFLLEFVSLPVLTGFISAAAITIILGQVPSIFGETGVGTGSANQIHDIFAKLPQTKPITFAVGFSGMVLLVILQVVGKRWGKNSKAVWTISIGRNALVILVFTIISFLLNRNLKTPLFDLTGKIPSGLVSPKIPNFALVERVFPSSIAVFLAASLEHIAIAKSFGRKNHYTISADQELTFLGVANLVNSFFGGMAVGGAASRTAVNSESGVKSPLYGIFTSSAVLVSIFFLTDALFWIPKATLSAVIIIAVWQIVVSPSVFISFWMISFADFVASQIAFWATLFLSAELGIGSATAFMVAVSILQTVFCKGKTVTSSNFKTIYPQLGSEYGRQDLKAGTQIIQFDYPIVFINASKTKESILDAVQTWNLGVTPSATTTSKNPNRLWNELGAKHIEFLRRKAGILACDEEYLPHIRVVVLDLQRVKYVDATGIAALGDMKTELRTYAGEEVEIHFAGLSKLLVSKFERAGWIFMDHKEVEGSAKIEDRVVLYQRLEEAIGASVNVYHYGFLPKNGGES